MFLPSQKLEKVPNTDEQHCRIHESASRAKSIQDGVKIFFRHRFQSVAELIKIHSNSFDKLGLAKIQPGALLNLFLISDKNLG